MSQTKATLTCDRTGPKTGKCELVTTSFRGSEVQQIPLSDLRGASVEQKRFRTRRGSRTEYQVVLHTTNSNIGIPLTRDFTDGYDTKKRIADEITTFVNSSAPTLNVTQDNRWNNFPFIVWFAVIGLMIVAFRKGTFVTNGRADSAVGASETTGNADTQPRHDLTETQFLDQLLALNQEHTANQDNTPLSAQTDKANQDE